MKWVKNDGGRKAAGYRGETRDCVTRSIAIVTGLEYAEVYDMVNLYTKGTKFSARKGVPKKIIKKIMEHLSWTWTPTMSIGSGCQVHLREDELPKGRLLVSLSRHTTAVLDGVIHDTHDPSRGGSRCVYGYWEKK